MKRAHVRLMTSKLPRRESSDADAGVAGMKTVRVCLVALAIGGCTGIPQDGRYQTGGGSWDNFRAQAATQPAERWS